MRVSDIIPILTESSDYQTEKKNNILSALGEVKSLEDLGKIVSYGSFRIKVGDSDHTTYYENASTIVEETPEIEQAMLEIIEKHLQNDDDIVFYFGSGLHYIVDFDKVLETKRKLFTEFFIRELELIDGKLQFKSEKIKQFPNYKKIMKLLLEHDHSAIYKLFGQMLSQLPTPKVKFDFKDTGFSWRGSGAISVDPKEFVHRFYHLCVLAYYLDEFSGNEEARSSVFKCQQYKSFSRGMRNEIKKMTSITEADVYQEEYSLFLNRHAVPEFFKSLSQFIRLLEDVHTLGRDIFAWFYHLPRHGQMHSEKQKFLDVYSETISRSNLMQYVKLESIFDDRSGLQDLVGYE